MLSGPTGGFTATMRVPGAAARSAARRIFSVIETVVFGLTTRMSMRCLGPPASQRSDQQQRYQDDGDADERGRDERQHHVAERLARRRAEVAGGLLVAVVEPVEDGEHDEQPEGQRPREMGAEPRRERARARRESLDEAGEADALRRPSDQRVEEA